MTNTPAPTPKRSRRRWLLIFVAVMLLCAVGSFVSQLFTDPDPDPAAQPEATAVAAQVDEDTPAPEPTAAPTAEPTNTPAPTAEPTATLAPADALRAAVLSALGDSNRDVDRLVALEDAAGRIEVDWAINDNLTEDLNRAGAQLDATEILRAIAGSGYPYEFILLRGTFPLIDQFGNIEEQKVVELFFEKPTVDQINFDNFSHRNIYNIADSAQIHPAFVRE